MEETALRRLRTTPYTMQRWNVEGGRGCQRPHAGRGGAAAGGRLGVVAGSRAWA